MSSDKNNVLGDADNWSCDDIHRLIGKFFPVPECVKIMQKHTLMATETMLEGAIEVVRHEMDIIKSPCKHEGATRGKKVKPTSSEDH